MSEKSDSKDSPRYPHLTIEGKQDIFEKKYSMGRSNLKDGGITKDDFKNKIDSVLAIEDVRTKFLGLVFFEIDLRVDYYTPTPQDLFKKLGVQVRGVFPSDDGYRKVIVSGPEDVIEKYKKRKTINKDFLKCIDNIRVIESKDKIGESIKKSLKKSSTVSTSITFLDKPSEEEINEIESIIPEIKREIKLSKHIPTASALLSQDTIQELAKVPIVKYISAPPVWEASLLARASNLSQVVEIQPPQNLESLPKVCVIDTGISEQLKDYSEYTAVEGLEPFDTDSHGSVVSSLCMFNKNDLRNTSKIIPSVKVLSHKISDVSIGVKQNFDLLDEIIGGMEKYRNKTRVFCLSWNCFGYDRETYEDALKYLDQYLQRNNLLLVNSSGNLEVDVIRALSNQYPKYLFENNVMTPSESKYTFTVGAIYRPSHLQVKLSPFSRTLLPLNAINKHEDRHIRIKPEVFAEGGHIVCGSTWDKDIEHGVPCLDHKCYLARDIGTSIAAPQVARAAALLLKKYSMKNIETTKALLFLKSEPFVQKENGVEYQGRILFDDSTVIDADDGFYLFFEGDTKPHERLEDKRMDKVFAMSWAFPVPKEIESVDFAICHSNSNPFEDLRTFSTRIVTSIHKPETKNPLAKEYGTMAKKAPLIFGRYRYTRNTPEGMWTIKAYVETTGVPQDLLHTVSIRYGVAVKLNIRSENQHEKDKIYAKILQALGKDASAYEMTEVPNLLGAVMTTKTVSHS